MITEINSALDYNPDLKQYDDNVARVINRHYLQVSSQYQWLFMQKRHTFIARKDISGSSTVTLTGNGSRKVSLPTTGASITNLPVDIEGQTLVVNDVEYLITRRIDARTFVLEDTLASGTYTSWTIKFEAYPMPRDSVEVLSVMDRGISQSETITYTDTEGNNRSTTSTLTGPNRGRFVFLDSRKEEYLYLDRSDTGEPFVSVEDMHLNIRPPDFAPFVSVKDDLDETDTTKGLASKETYEYCYTYLFAGKESPPSPVVSVDTSIIKDEESTGRIKVLLSRLMDTSAQLSSLSDKDTGRLKKIYRRLVTPLTNLSRTNPGRLDTGVGNWRHIATISEGTTEYTDKGLELESTTVLGSDGTLSERVDPSGDVFGVSMLNEIGPRQYMRFWYTPSSSYPVEARYHRRPFRLVNDSDSPEWPVQYHSYLVYAALKDICMQHGMLKNSQLYDGRAKELLERMKSKYLSRTDRLHIRRGFDRAMADRERFGIPSKS
jgi:hypothetical protein